MKLTESNHRALSNVAKKVLQFELNGKVLDRKRLNSTFHLAEKTIQSIQEGNEATLIKAPTGSGKSLLAFIFALYAKEAYSCSEEEKACYLITPRKSLQEQYARDIENFNLEIPLLKGQASYRCSVDNSKTFANRPCNKDDISTIMKELPCAKECPYLVNRSKAIKSDISVLNNHYLITALLNNHRDFKERHLLVIDEAHQFNEILREMYSITISPKDSKQALIECIKDVEAYSPETPLEHDKLIDALHDISFLLDEIASLAERDNQWIGNIPKIVDKIVSIKNGMDNVLTPLITVLDKRDGDGNLKYDDLYIDGLKDEIALYGSTFETINRIHKSVELDPKNLIVDVGENGVKFSLNRVENMYKAIFGNFKHVIFLSATPSKTFFEELGITKGKKIKIKSTFSIATSPVVMPTDMMVSMTYTNRDENYQKLFESVETIVRYHTMITVNGKSEPRPNAHNGFIHTGSYLFQSLLKEYFENHVFMDNFIWCSNSADIEVGIKELESRPNEGLTLISPSILEGVDGRGGTARYQIALKCPFPSLKDRYVQRLLDENVSLFNDIVRRQIEQLIGRVQRSPKDIGITYLLDSSFRNFIFRNSLSEHPLHKCIEVPFSKIGSVLRDAALWAQKPPSVIKIGKRKGFIR